MNNLQSLSAYLSRTVRSASVMLDTSDVALGVILLTNNGAAALASSSASRPPLEYKTIPARVVRL